MITLNLLPPALKSSLRAHAIYAALEQIMVIACSLLLLSSLALLLIRIRLISVLDDVQSRQILSAEYTTTNKDVVRLNTRIGRIEALQNLQISSTALLFDIARRTTPAVGITSLEFDIASASLHINGRADQRDALLAFEQSLKESPYVKSVESPISNLFKKNDINFQLKIVLNTAALKSVFSSEP
jgi:Tfp pilus assembly protein PilN